MLEPPQLFTAKRDIVWFVLLLGIVFSFTVFLHYRQYKIFTAYQMHTVYASIINQYSKTDTRGDYYMLKLKTDGGLNIYTAKGLYIGKVLGDRVEAQLYTPHRLSFLDFLRGFYAKSKIVKLYANDSFKAKLRYEIASQHKDTRIQELYGALYTAAAQDKVLRQKFSTLGV